MPVPLPTLRNNQCFVGLIIDPVPANCTCRRPMSSSAKAPPGWSRKFEACVVCPGPSAGGLNRPPKISLSGGVLIGCDRHLGTAKIKGSAAAAMNGMLSAADAIADVAVGFLAKATSCPLTPSVPASLAK